MSTEHESEPKIIVDEDWKSKVAREREQLQQQSSQPPEEQSSRPPQFPPATFAGLVHSLSTEAAAALTDVVAPAPDEKEREQRLAPALALALAKHLIDTLAVLEEKTRGNLSSQEVKLLQQTLHELRIAYVEVQNR